MNIFENNLNQKNKEMERKWKIQTISRNFEFIQNIKYFTHDHTEALIAQAICWDEYSLEKKLTKCIVYRVILII